MNKDRIEEFSPDQKHYLDMLITNMIDDCNWLLLELDNVANLDIKLIQQYSKDIKRDSQSLHDLIKYGEY